MKNLYLLLFCIILLSPSLLLAQEATSEGIGVEVPVNVPPSLVVYIALITGIIEAIKKAVPKLASYSFVPILLSFVLGIGASFYLTEGELTSKIMAGIALGLAASGLYSQAKRMGTKKV